MIKRHYSTSSTDLSPYYQYLAQQAQQLLLNENKSVAQVAVAVGYESVSQFSREYHRFFGVTAMADKGQS